VLLPVLGSILLSSNANTYVTTKVNINSEVLLPAIVVIAAADVVAHGYRRCAAGRRLCGCRHRRRLVVVMPIFQAALF
jgi:hypothetical protein